MTVVSFCFFLVGFFGSTTYVQQSYYSCSVEREREKKKLLSSFSSFSVVNGDSVAWPGWYGSSYQLEEIKRGEKIYVKVGTKLWWKETKLACLLTVRTVVVAPGFLS